MMKGLVLGSAPTGMIVQMIKMIFLLLMPSQLMVTNFPCIQNFSSWHISKWIFHAKVINVVWKICLPWPLCLILGNCRAWLGSFCKAKSWEEAASREQWEESFEESKGGFKDWCPAKVLSFYLINAASISFLGNKICYLAVFYRVLYLTITCISKGINGLISLQHNQRPVVSTTAQEPASISIFVAIDEEHRPI